MADVSSPGASTGPLDTPRAPQSHFFPSVSRAQRDLARQARLAAASPEPITSSTPPAPSPPPHDQLAPGKIRGIEALLSAAGGAGHGGGSGGAAGVQDDERREPARVRHAAPGELGSSGPFALRRPSYASSQHSFVSATPSKAASADDDDDERRGVGAGGSGGTKRRRDVDRTGWDAASDLMQDDEVDDERAHGRGGGDREKTPTPNLGRGPAAAGRGVSFQGGERPSRSRYESSTSPGLSPGASSKPGSIASVERDDDAAMDDDASIMTSRTGATGNMVDDDDDGNQPAKKRSRTLTTPAQTAVLNALLAKVRPDALSPSLAVLRRRTDSLTHVHADSLSLDRDARGGGQADWHERSAGADLVPERASGSLLLRRSLKSFPADVDSLHARSADNRRSANATARRKKLSPPRPLRPPRWRPATTTPCTARTRR